MTSPFKPVNDLDADETERLALLIEECAEVQWMAAKILRHGYKSYNPDHVEHGDNRTQLSAELGDLWYAMMLCYASDDFDDSRMTAQVLNAARDKQQYLHHQDSRQLETLVRAARKINGMDDEADDLDPLTPWGGLRII